MEKIRKHFYFSGRVQGVGFRYRSYYIAQSMGLTGWVRNLWDDRVEMEVQGTREEIREMVERLSQQSFVEIEGIEAEGNSTGGGVWLSCERIVKWPVHSSSSARYNRTASRNFRGLRPHFL